MINKLDYCIKGLIVSFITEQHVFMVNFSLISNLKYLVLFMIPRWGIGGWIPSGATIVVISVQGFPLFQGRGSGLCDVIAACFFLLHLFLSYPWFTTTGPLALLLSNRGQVFMLAAPSFPPSHPPFLSLASSAICLPDCLEFNWNTVHIVR